MCELCDITTRRQYATSKAEMYERMASYYRRIANGALEPHTEEFKKVTSGTATAILTDLANGWSFG